MPCTIWEGGDLIMVGEIPILTIKLPEGRFQTFHDISLSEELRWKSRCPSNKTFIRGTSPDIPYELWDKNTICWQRWNIATQEQKVCDMEVEIVMFVVKGKYAADRDPRSTEVNPSRKQRCCSPSCLWSQAQRDTSDPDNSQNLGCWLTKRHRCICIWSWTEMLFFSFRFRANTVCIPLRMSTEICQRGEGHNLFPSECRLIVGKPFPRRPRKCCRLETLAC